MGERNIGRGNGENGINEMLQYSVKEKIPKEVMTSWWKQLLRNKKNEMRGIFLYVHVPYTNKQ